MKPLAKFASRKKYVLSKFNMLKLSFPSNQVSQIEFFICCLYWWAFNKFTFYFFMLSHILPLFSDHTLTKPKFAFIEVLG